MRVLVTGHQGYIGGILAPALVHRGHEVMGCDIGLFDQCRFLDEPDYCENLSLDIRDIGAKDLADFDAVIHLAGLSNDPLGDINPKLTFEINLDASIRLAQLAKAAGVKRFLFASSCSNYGSYQGKLLDESAPFYPVTPYGESKSKADAFIASLASDDFHPCNLRAGTVYGIAPRMRFDLVLNNLVAYAVSSGSVYLKSDGTVWRPLIHVRDLALAYSCLLETDEEVISGQSFNVGRTDQNFQIKTLAAKIIEQLPHCSLDMKTNAQSDQRDYRVNCEKLRHAVPTFDPHWTIDQGITELIETLMSESRESIRFRRR